MPADICGTGLEFERLVIGIVLKFAPRKRSAIIDTAVSAVIERLPSKSRGSSGTSAKVSLMNLDTCWRAPTVITLTELIEPSPPRRRVSVTLAGVLLGFAIATP